jgi:hypothetical protein
VRSTKIEMAYAWAMPSPWTFSIPPIAELVERYLTTLDSEGMSIGRGWADPFSGKSTLAEFGNDIDPAMPATSHADAIEFARTLPDGLRGVLFDPPYSFAQNRENYPAAALRASQKAWGYDGTFFGAIKDVLGKKILTGGIAITCGWNSGGFGMVRGFEKIELLVVCHGCDRHDTLVVVERKFEGSAETLEEW